MDARQALFGPAEAGGRKSLVHQAGGGALAIRSGKWKLIPNAGRKNVGPELFNLGEDLSEKRNVAAANLDVVKSLSAELAAIRKEEGR